MLPRLQRIALTVLVSALSLEEGASFLVPGECTRRIPLGPRRYLWQVKTITCTIGTLGRTRVSWSEANYVTACIELSVVAVLLKALSLIESCCTKSGTCPDRSLMGEVDVSAHRGPFRESSQQTPRPSARVEGRQVLKGHTLGQRKTKAKRT